MHAPRQPNNVLTNRLLSALPRAEFDRLAPHLEQVNLPKNSILYDAGDVVRHAYFLQSGMISLLSVTNKNQVLEVGVVGDEGMVGIPSALRNNRAPLRTLVQIPITALRISGSTLRQEFRRGGELQDLLLCYTHSLATQIGQIVACNRYHTNEQKLARWLLMTRDRVHGDTFNLTHDFLAYMLGTTRTNVTDAAGKLRDAGLIHYLRGKITILNGKKLEAVACECYHIIAEDKERFIAA